MLTEYDRDRFDSRWQPEPNSGCHLWTSYCFSSGYPAFWLRGKQRIAMQVACEIAGREVSFGCHKCHNKLCVNEAHIVNGNAKINSNMEGIEKLKATAQKAHATRQSKRDLPMYVTREAGRLRVKWKKESLGFVDTVEEALAMQQRYNDGK